MGLFVALALVAASVQATPEQPDFSGRWVLSTSAAANPDTPRRLIVVQPIVRTNVFGAPIKPAFLSVSVRREGVSANSDETRVIGAMGGAVPGLSEGIPVGNVTRVETVWRGHSLVFVNMSYGPDGPRTGDWTERREVWSLQRDGRLRVELSVEHWNSARRVDVYYSRRESRAQ
jgi:hypothetical protein